MSTDEEWKKNADTHKMNPDGAAKRPPGHNPGGVLHQRRSLPYSPAKMAVGGFFIIAAVGYATLYYKKKPEASALDVAKVSAGVARPEETHPRVNKDLEPQETRRISK